MEKTRSIKELLTFMLENMHLFRHGLCCWCYEMKFVGIISNIECSCILRYIEKNKPTGLIAKWNRDNDFYWKRGNIKPRIKWIKKHIKKLS